MKELSVKEKAKAYDEVRTKIKMRFGSNVADEIFSEFEESEDERIREAAKYGLQHLGWEHINGIKMRDILAWLEKVGEQKPSEEYNITGISSNKSQGKLGEIIKNLKTTWSEGDENYHRICLDLCTGMPNGGAYAPYIKDEAINWLKSIKERYTWKPSDEQMKQLGWVVVQNKDNVVGKELMTLYNDLEKLKG